MISPLALGSKSFKLRSVGEQPQWLVALILQRIIFESSDSQSNLAKRPVSINQVEDVVDDIEREMLRREEAEVVSRVIGNAILKRLKKLDKVAWLRFASVYLEFEDLSDFEKAIEK